VLLVPGGEEERRNSASKHGCKGNCRVAAPVLGVRVPACLAGTGHVSSASVHMSFQCISVQALLSRNLHTLHLQLAKTQTRKKAHTHSRRRACRGADFAALQAHHTSSRTPYAARVVSVSSSTPHRACSATHSTRRRLSVVRRQQHPHASTGERNTFPWMQLCPGSSVRLQEGFKACCLLGDLGLASKP